MTTGKESLPELPSQNTEECIYTPALQSLCQAVVCGALVRERVHTVTNIIYYIIYIIICYVYFCWLLVFIVFLLVCEFGRDLVEKKMPNKPGKVRAKTEPPTPPLSRLLSTCLAKPVGPFGGCYNKGITPFLLLL